MRLFLTGGSGQLGTEVLAAAAEAGHEILAPTSAAMDIRDPATVRETIEPFAPDVVIHAAAFTAVDRCESDCELAYDLNVTGTENVVSGARAAGARVLYVSTDYVFDGTKTDPYTESDATNPLSVYGASKLGGEHALGESDTTVRTSWVVGANGTNMMKTILRLADSHPHLSFVSDQRGHPTFTSDLAMMLIHLAQEPLPGIVHATNQGAVSWFEFAQAVLSAAGQDPDRVSPITTDELKPARPAPRPKNSVLENAALKEAGRPLLPNFKKTLTKVINQISS